MMKRASLALMAAMISAGLLWAAYQASAPHPTQLSPWFPAGSMLYLEAKDFSSLLAAWNASPQKRTWADSSNYQVFSRSRLFLRLQEAADQFSAAAGLPPDMDFLSQVAGGHSAMALYDIGNLQFLYVTYLPSAKSIETTLWQSRAKFEPRSAGGVSFFVRRDPESQKEVAFAISGDYLLLATREDLVRGALELMSGSKDLTIETEPWWSQSVAAAGPAGELRMVLNLEKLVPSPYFRTYWVQQNITDLKQYSAAVSDLFRSRKEYREERVLIAKAARAPALDTAARATAELVRLVPENAGIYQAKASPSPRECADLLETKLLAPHSGQVTASKVAPEVELTSGETGTRSDLETRIDYAPVRAAVSKTESPLSLILEKSPILASLEVQSTEPDPSGVFVRVHAAVVLLSSSEWNPEAVESAFSDSVAPTLTASQLGVKWEQKSAHLELDGLWPLALAIRGKYLIVADDPALIERVLSNFARSLDTEPAVFIAAFSHARERNNFSRFTGVLDHNHAPADFSGQARQPEFFSENISSLSALLSHLASEKIVIRTDGTKTLEVVTYERAE
jgi:hypothetical protein